MIQAIDKVTFYLKDVVAELKKVTWSNKQELMGSTGVVIVLSLVLAFFLFIIDNILARLLNLLF